MSMMEKFVGISCSLFGSITHNLGINLMKKSHNLENIKLEQDRRPYILQPFWWIGFFFFFVGTFGDLGALAFVEPAVLAPVGSISLVSNCFFAWLILHERFTFKIGVSTSLVILGAALAASFSVHNDQDLDLEMLLSFFRRGEYTAYIVVVCLLSCGLIGYFIFCKLYIRKHNLLALSNMPVAMYRVSRFAVPAFTGLVGSQTVLFTRSALLLLSFTVSETNQFDKFESFLIVFLALGSAIFQIHFLNVSLSHFNALYVVPTFYVVWTTSSIMGSASYYNDFNNYSTENFVGFVVGVAFVFCGVVVLSTIPPYNTEQHTAITKSRALAMRTYSSTSDIEIGVIEPLVVREETKRRHRSHSFDDSVLFGFKGQSNLYASDEAVTVISERVPNISISLHHRRTNPPISAPCSPLNRDHFLVSPGDTTPRLSFTYDRARSNSDSISSINLSSTELSGA